jgi:uncharacterized protein (DUF952 family)
MKGPSRSPPVAGYGPTGRPAILAAMELRHSWERAADQWIAWARQPGHDSYWRFHRRRLLNLLPAPGRLTLDLGCGEGRVGRDLQALGHRVVGLDVAAALVAAAANHGQPTPVLRADVARLPVAGGVADLALAFMSPQDVDDLEAMMAEVFRALEPGGRLYLAITHPLNSGGRFDRAERPARLSLRWPYMEERSFVDDEERDGLTMAFASRHRPFEVYARALERAGFVTEMVREVTSDDPSSRWFDVPVFLHLVAVRPPVVARLDRRLFHIASVAEADGLVTEGVLVPASLVTEGFVHCSTAAQVVATTQRWFEPGAELVLLEFDPELLDVDVAWPEVYPGQRFPHPLGPLKAEAVVARHPWGAADRVRWNANGTS